MQEVRLTHAFDMRLTVEMPPLNLGETAMGGRVIATVTGGEITGPLLQGKVRGGGDWLLTRPDGVTQLDVRLTIEAADGALIYVRYEGFRHGPADVMARLMAGEAVDPSLYYFRAQPRLETSAPAHLWVNRHLFIATGVREPEGPVYSVYKVE
ncbi:DUF3237 domain-containing protein [Sneathiella sp.]|uniref:DUF3237 domain-containing protein n=1 Tax=Sneathiella sp. TaxID=1964365 RepID=UPI002FE24D36